MGYSPRAKPMLKPNTIPHPRNRRARSAQSPPSFVLRFSPCAPGLRGKSILFIRLRTLCRRQKSHLLWNQQLPDSFAKTPGWGVCSQSAFHSTSHAPCSVLRWRNPYVTPVPVLESLPTRGSLMLVFGLQDAARAAQVLGVAHVLSLCLRFECFPCGRRTSRRAFSREGHLMPGAAAQKGTTNP